MLVPEADIARVADAHARLCDAIQGLADTDVRRPSLLPGWSVGHVLTHIARNADSHIRRTAAAAQGEMTDQYEGGFAGREAEIEAGAGRSAAEIVADVRQSADTVDAAWRSVEPSTWAGRTRDVNGRQRPLFELPSRRWQEVEVHLVDIDVGVAHRDWPADFVLVWLPRTRERVAGQLPPEPAGLQFDDPRDELAWLYGRFTRDDLPQPPSWG